MQMLGLRSACHEATAKDLLLICFGLRLQGVMQKYAINRKWFYLYGNAPSHNRSCTLPKVRCGSFDWSLLQVQLSSLLISIYGLSYGEDLVLLQSEHSCVHLLTIMQC